MAKGDYRFLGGWSPSGEKWDAGLEEAKPVPFIPASEFGLKYDESIKMTYWPLVGRHLLHSDQDVGHINIYCDTYNQIIYDKIMSSDDLWDKDIKALAVEYDRLEKAKWKALDSHPTDYELNGKVIDDYETKADKVFQQYDTIKLLSEGSDLNVKDEEGMTLLHRSATTGNTEIAKLLITNGADVDVRDPESMTALHHAVSEGHTEIADLLIANGADINVEKNDRWTPLHIAILKGNKEIVELLIAKGADVNAGDKLSGTPLYVAVAGGHKQITELLISKGVNVNDNNILGSTPLHWAVFKGYTEIAELLLSKGADVNGKDNDGNTPLDDAKTEEMKTLLLKHGAKYGKDIK